MSLHIFRPPYSLSSGNDLLGEVTVAELTRRGVHAYAHDNWPDNLAGLLNSGRIPLGRTIFSTFIAARAAARTLEVVRPEDSAWILGSIVPLRDDPAMEKALKARCKSYFYHLIDNWLAVPHLREGTLQRCGIADAVVVPTPQIEAAAREAGVTSDILLLEEPIDVQRLDPAPHIPVTGDPFVVWCGNPNNVRNLEKLLPWLNQVHESCPFTLRVISNGKPSADFRFSGRVEWLPYERAKEPSQLAGAVAGLAPLEDSPYNRCKGAYKIKTYMAAGLPVVASDTGFQRTLMERSEVGVLARSPEEFAEGVKRLLLDNIFQRRLSRQARDTACARYSHSAIIPTWLEKLSPYL